jgi:tetratricopeptide (TPR) repeat protein
MRTGCLALMLLLPGCTHSERSSAPGPAALASEASIESRPAPGSLSTPARAAADAGALAERGVAFIADDMPRAEALAKAQGKALFVDAWAVWCHTCLSMRNYVLNQPALGSLEARVVFAAIDTDRAENARFLERHAVSAWPTFFVIDPRDDRVVGYWPGSGSLTEMRGFIEDSLESVDTLEQGNLAAATPLSLLLQAKAAEARSENAAAADLYARAVSAAPPDWRRRSEAVSGWIEALFRAGKAEPCVKIGLDHLSEIEGSARPTDMTHLVFECTQGLPEGRRTPARRALVERLRGLALHPSPDASPDDRADTQEQLADALSVMGDRAGARAAEERRLTILEQAAAAAPSPEAAATYDYGRASAYRSLGRIDEAVRMLEQRERQLPDSYEPSARLAAILADLGRWPEARSAIDRALAHAYGPRRLRYLALKARVQQKLGDNAGAVSTLEEEVRGHSELERKTNDPGLRDANKRLAEARSRAR